MKSDNQLFFEEYASHIANTLKERGWGQASVPFAMFLAKTNTNNLELYPEQSYWFNIFVATVYEEMKKEEKYDSFGNKIMPQQIPDETSFLAFLSNENEWDKAPCVECNDIAHYLLDRYRKSLQLLKINDEMKVAGGWKEYTQLSDKD